jgi:hypothetical protein
VKTEKVAGLSVDKWHLRCFLQDLENGEREYLESLDLGCPQSLHTFVITEDRDSNRATTAIGVLYSEVFTLFRYRARRKLHSWDTISDSPEEQCLLIYGYLYPRHIKCVYETRNGIFVLRSNSHLLGFRIDCGGLWLGDGQAEPAELLMLEFQEPDLPDHSTAAGWMHSLETFRGGDPPEIGTIFDRLPLDPVRSIEFTS